MIEQDYVTFGSSYSSYVCQVLDLFFCFEEIRTGTKEKKNQGTFKENLDLSQVR